jgi:hypothetical protein
MTGNSALILALVCGFDGRGIRLLGTWLDSFPGRGQRPNAGNRSRHPGRCGRLPGSAIQDHQHRGRGAGRADRLLPGRQDGHRLRDWRGAVGRLRLHRHERVRARQCAHRTGRHQGHWPGTGRGLSRRRHHRHAGGGPGPAGRDRLLLVPHGRRHPNRRQGPGRAAEPADRLCVRLVTDLHFCASGRRHLHQGRRRGRRPGGQGGSRHPRGRPAQPGRDCRQRGRQRGRLRGHGRRPV